MADYVASERGTTIRVPSTANFMVDSADRVNQGTTTASNILISTGQSLVNGFFSRIGTTEVVLEWRSPNVAAAQNNNTFTVDVSGVGPQVRTLPDAFYTAASAIKAIVALMNDISGTLGTTFTAAGSNGLATITPTNGAIRFRLFGYAPTVLGIATGVYTAAGAPLVVNGVGVDLRPYRYLDFVSAQLTYNQDLKDGSTAGPLTRDVLCRWYFAFDQPPALDEYGMPILMGYTPFVLRRLFNPPKQIRWDPRQPVGQLSFQVYGNGSTSFAAMPDSEWLMTLQLSEV